MALQQFAQGLKTGMAPYLSQAFENKAADKDTERKLKYLKQLGAIQLKQKQLEEKMQFEEQLQRLSGVLKGVPGMPQQTPGLLAAGVEPSKVGMEMPLGPRGQNIFDLEKMRLQEGIESEKARRASDEAQRQYYGQSEISQDPGSK